MPNDPRIRAFLDRAAAVVAASKGLTVECQQQLEVLATQLRLDHDQWQQCLDELKNQTRAVQSYSRYEQAFLDAAEKNLASIAGRILSLGKEKLLLDLAADKFQIGQVRAHQLLDSCCEDLDIRRISRTDTEASFRVLATGLIGSARRAAPETVSQLIDAGKGWGLTETEVRGTVNHVVMANASRRRRRIAKAVKLLFLIAILAGILVWSSNLADQVRRGNWNQADTVANNEVPRGTHPADWFPGDKVDALVESIDKGRPLSELCNRLSHESATDRAETYSQIAGLSLDPFGPAPESVADLLDILLTADPERGEMTGWEIAFAAELETRVQSVPVSSEALRRAVRLAELTAQMDRNSKNDDSNVSAPGILASLNRTRLGANGPAGLILQWWSQLVYQEPLPVSKALAVTGPLHQFSLQYLPEQLANQWRHRLLLRVVQAKPENISHLEEELRNAILGSGQTELESWIQVWRQVGPASLRDLIGRLVIQRISGDQQIVLGRLVESTMRDVSSELVRKRYAAILELADLADRSLNAARMAQLDRADDPASIVLTAQAVNDALQVIVQMDPPGGNQAVGRQTASPWRYEPFANREVVAEPGSPGNLPQATPADFRTLDEAIAEFESASVNPDRSGHRILALEDLQRIAPRMDDVSAATANTLANWFLQDMPIEEWLAVEKSLPAFRFWPTFGMALADRIGIDPINSDQAISITQLVADPGFRLDKSGDWRAKCSQSISKNVIQILDRKTLQSANRKRDQWLSARQTLGKLYFTRRQILGLADNETVGQLTPSVQAIRLAASGLGLRESGDSGFQIAMGIDGGNELEVTVQAVSIWARQSVDRLRHNLPERETGKSLANDNQFQSGKPANLGQQLLLLESESLEFVTLVRRYLVQRATMESP